MTEEELRAAFARQTQARPNPVDLANRVIAMGRAQRRRRIAAISVTGALAALVLLSVTLIRLPGGESEPASSGATADPGPTATATPGELADLPTGNPVRLAVFGQHTVRLPAGGEVEINDDPREIVTDVVRAAGAWVVRSSSPERELGELTMVRDDESTTTLGQSVVSAAVTPAGDRVAVQSRVGEGQRIDVIAVPSGMPVAVTSLPGDVDTAPIVTGWVGSLVLLSAPNGDAGPVATDVWDPMRGPYRSSLSGARLLLGPAPDEGQLLALEPDAEPGSSNACLTWVDPVKAFTVLARKCQVGLKFGDRPPWLSPDGGHLVAWHPDHDNQLVATDVRVMESTPLGLPGNVVPTVVVWEAPDTALVRVEPEHGASLNSDRLDVLRCKLDGSPCELAPVPEVDGGVPVGFVG